MSDKTNLYGLTYQELEDLMVSLGYKKYSGRQIFQWMYQKKVFDFGQMTNLSKKLRAELEENYSIALPRVLQAKVSEDQTVKYLFELFDGSLIEAVKIPDDPRLTLCMSSQVGCPLGCKFCKTAQIGFKRNLEVGEILSQLALVQMMLKPEERITNLVFMGMGEPFLNYDNVKAAIETIMSVLAFGIGHSKITLSTAGHVPGIYRMTDDGLKVRLAVSLNSADPEVRRRLMPITKKYSLDELRKALIYHTSQAGRRVTFEYLLISGITDTIASAKKLVKFVDGIPCKINLINYNPSEGLPGEFKPSNENDLFKFRDYLYPRTPAVTVRASKGIDIKAACGQLAAKHQ
ncbi:MAG: 23S rRNA (adenine(2503)-C(2))-methyltransferase RlmN [candidate division Zixibacteria bacterium]|nr:23S rRNA (adenine(2503)-C(2))-methyltransferase RlmN [candidate division Zixibacteria bacterium]